MTFQTVTVIPGGKLATIAIDCSIEETHEDTLQVTEHPVEAGAQITDHSFKRPVEVRLRCGWSNSSASALIDSVSAFIESGALSLDDYAANVYSQLLNLQESRKPFSIQTSIRNYDNMLITGLHVTRDSKTSNVLMVVATCREVIIVNTQSTTITPQENLANPAANAPVQKLGVAQLLQTASSGPSPGGSVPPSQWTGNAKHLVIDIIK